MLFAKCRAVSLLFCPLEVDELLMLQWLPSNVDKIATHDQSAKFIGPAGVQNPNDMYMCSSSLNLTLFTCYFAL